jgi:hypothetical protein
MSTYPPPSGYPPQGPPPYAAPQWTPPPPPAGMGCGMKLLVLLGVVFLLLILLCCGGGFLLKGYFQRSAVKDPAEVEAVTAKIAAIEIPPPLKPAGGMSLEIPFIKKTLMLFAMYGDKPEGKADSPAQDSTLVLFALGDAFRGQNQEQMRRSIQEALDKQGMQKQEVEQLRNEQHSEKQVTIRGQKATFTITKGIGSKSKKPRMQVQGTFEGAAGPVLLLADVDTEQIGADKVLKMLDSIH